MNTTVRRDGWIDGIKGWSLLAVMANHFGEQWFGAAQWSNPNANWGSVVDRWNELSPLQFDSSLESLLMNAVRYLAILGDWGVGVFLICSGYLLARSASHSRKSTDGSALERRILRLYPEWWLAHAIFLLVPAFLGFRASLLDWQFYASIVGIRVTETSIYYGYPAWWFFSLILQLYLVFPWIWRACIRFGTIPTCIGLGVLAIGIRGLGMFYFDEYLDVWSRGGIFITRLPEFLFGIAMAHTAWTMGWRSRIAATCLLLLAGFVAGFTLTGMIIAPLLLSTGLLGLMALCVHAAPKWFESRVNWLGQHSYSWFLTHHFFIVLLIRPYQSGNLVKAGALFAIAIMGTFIASFVLEMLADRVRQAWKSRNAPEVQNAMWRVGTIVVVLYSIMLAAEFAVRKFDPQEVPEIGWGEKQSFVPDAELGYRLRPNSETRLRWESYDYVVSSNAEGFPEPEFPAPERNPSVRRMMTFGDAFTSGEGVGTKGAWPSLLQSQLDAEDDAWQVMNFGISGYGPHQYELIARDYIPHFRPDVLVIASFVNELSDVMMSPSDFQQAIGFSKPDPDALSTILSGRHLARWIHVNIKDPGLEWFLGRPQSRSINYGQVEEIRRETSDSFSEARERLTSHFADIQGVCLEHGCRMIVVMVPSSIQVCDPTELRYYPRKLNLLDEQEFNLNAPQETMSRVCNQLRIECEDLRPYLSQFKGHGLYQPANMHWTAKGHEKMAAYIRELLR